MLNFHPITLNDRDAINAILKNVQNRGCEYSFANLFIWAGAFGTEVAYDDVYMTVRFSKEGSYYLYPAGAGDGIPFLKELCKDPGMKVIAASPEDVENVKRELPNLIFEETPEAGEYVYNSLDLRELAGKKYHQKRNHAARFERANPGYRFEPITRKNIEDVRRMSEQWYREFNGGEESGIELEHIAVNAAFDHFFELGLDGGCLITDRGVSAFSMGEPLNDSVYCVHIEKAFHSEEGAYTVINRDFARYYCAGYPFINREDDAGEPGLRKAKHSYHPVQVTRKYMITKG